MSMTLGIGLWIGKVAATQAAKAALEKLLSKSLQKELDKVLAAWAGALPPEAYVSPATLSIDPGRAKGGLANLPTLRQLGDTIAGGQLPNQALWLAALVEQRQKIREMLEGDGIEPQPFFLLTDDQASPYLTDLAQRIDLKCREQEPLARTHTTLKVDEIAGQMSSLAVVLDLVADKVNDEITAAFEFTKTGQPSVTVTQLDKLREKKWAALNAHARYRLYANRGNALYSMGKWKEAANDYLTAHSHDPDDDAARALQAVAHMFLDDHEKAFELASKLCEDRPTLSKAQAVRVRSAPSTQSHLALAESVPVALRSDPEILMALYQRAKSEGLISQAEDYIRKACESSPDWIEAQLALTSTLLQGVMLRLGYPMAPDSVPSLPEESARAVKHARDILTKLIVRLGEGNSHARAMAHFNRAGAHGLLGDWRSRMTDLHDARRISPTPDYALALGLGLDASGDLDAAIRVFQEQCERAGSRKLRVLLATSLRDRNKPGDRQAAIDTLRRDLELEDNEEEDSGLSIGKADVVQILSGLLVDVSGHESAAACLKDLLDAGKISPALHSLLDAGLHLKAGRKDHAREIVRSLAAVPGLEATEARILARSLKGLGDAALAVPIWERLAQPPDRVTADTLELVDCARQAGRDAVVLERCAAVRAAGMWVRELASVEIDTLLKYHENAEVIPLLADYLRRVPSDVRARLNLSILGIQLNRSELVDTDPASYPSAGEVAADLGKTIVGVLATAPDGSAALRYAYDLVRRHPDSPDAHQALVGLCLPGLGRVIEQTQPDVVGPGVAVEIQPVGGRPKRWVVIEDADDPPPSSSRHEYAPTSPTARALMGKRPGDDAEIPINFGTVSARVERLATKYDFRAQDSLSSFETQFPDESFVTKRSVPPSVADPKTIRDVLGDDLVELLSKSEDLRERTKQLYTSHSVPIAMLVGLGSKSYIEVHGFLVGSPDISLRCSVGRAEELKEASRIAQTSGAVVMDESALTTIFLLGQGSLIQKLPFECHVPEAFLGELRELLRKFTRDGKEILTIGTVDGEPRVTRVAADAVQQQHAEIETFLSTLGRYCKTFGGSDLAHVDVKHRRWLDALSPSTAYSMATAARRGIPLWTDDHAIAGLSRELGVTDRTWTQAVAFGLRSAGKIDQSVVDEISVRLNEWRYLFTSLSPSGVLHALKSAQWEVDREPAKSALDHFGVSMDVPVFVGFFVGVLQLVWGEAPEAARVRITVRILERASQQADSRRLLFRISRHIEQVFRSRPILAARVRSVIESWLAGSRGGLILPPTPGQLLAFAATGPRCPRCGAEALVIVIRHNGQSVVCCERCRPA